MLISHCVEGEIKSATFTNRCKAFLHGDDLVLPRDLKHDSWDPWPMLVTQIGTVHGSESASVAAYTWRCWSMWSCSNDAAHQVWAKRMEDSVKVQRMRGGSTCDLRPMSERRAYWVGSQEHLTNRARQTLCFCNHCKALQLMVTGEAIFITLTTNSSLNSKMATMQVHFGMMVWQDDWIA